MRLINNSDSIQVKSDELTWLFVCGGLFLSLMAWFVFTEGFNQKIGCFLLMAGFIAWVYLLWKSENTIFSVVKSEKKIILRKFWFHQEIVFVESEQNKWSQVILEEHADGGCFLLQVVIGGEKYSLFNHYSNSGKVFNAHSLLLRVMEESKT